MTEHHKDDERVYKEARFVLEPGKPLRFIEEAECEAPANTSSLGRCIGVALKAYRSAGFALASGKYASWQALAPPQFRAACHVLVLVCIDGVIVRYELAGADEPKVRVAQWAEPLELAAPKFSEFMIHFPSDPATYVPAATGSGICWQTGDGIGGSQEQGRFHPVVVGSTSLPPTFVLQPPGSRPPVLASLTNEFSMRTEGVELPNGARIPLSPLDLPPEAIPFVVQSRIELPVGWCAVEVYPLLGDDYWQPSFAPLWAEIDLLWAVAVKNATAEQISEMDSMALAREHHAKTIAEFEELLDGPEEPVHQFLRRHPHLISQTFVRYHSKTEFGKCTSDFVFCEPTNDYLLVEIEAPHRKLFRKDGHPNQWLQHALNQSADWVRFIADNKSYVERELGLIGISSTPRRLIVMGRSASITPENRRSLVQIQSDRQHLTVLTYDDLVERARANLGRLFGSLSLKVSGARVYFPTTPGANPD
jgi:hypothetical protein